LDKIATILSENDALEIEVSSYTDSRGSSAYNIQLSNRRAKSTVDYLVSQGIDRNRIKSKGYGESRMINKCVNGVECSEEAHAKNRRTEFVILNPQAYIEPEKKQSSKQPVSIANTKKNDTKNKEITVAKHLYNNTKDTDETNKSIVSESINDLNEVNEGESISLNNEIETSISKKNTKEDLLLTDSNTDESNQESSSDALVVTETIQNKKNILKTDNNEDVLVVDNKTDSNEVNHTDKIEELSASDIVTAQTTQKSSKETLENKSLTNDDSQVGIISNQLDTTDSTSTSIKESLKAKSDLSEVVLNDENKLASNNQPLKKKRLEVL